MRVLPLLFLLLVPFNLLATPAIQRTILPNGTTLVVEEDHAAPVAMVQIWLRVGGRDELPGKTGLAHVFEHMMFKGSKLLPPGEYSKRIARMGGNDNAFTSTDYTAYFETIPAARVHEVLDMEAERFGHLRLAASEFAREIEVIKEERRLRTDDDPNSRLFEELSAVAMRLHPYRNPVIGWMQDLEHLTIHDVRNFYASHYVPGNAIVVVVGDVKFGDVKKWVAGNFGKLPARSVAPRFDPQEPEPLGPRRIELHLPAQLPLIAFTLPVPVWRPGAGKEVAALALATEILAGGQMAQLQRELVDKQRLAFEFSAGYDPFAMGNDLWYAYATLGKEQSAATCEQGFWKFMAGFAASLNEETLARTKKRMVANEIYAQDSPYLRAKRIGILEVNRIAATDRDLWLADLKATTLAEVQQAANRWLLPNRAATGLLMPEVK